MSLANNEFIGCINIKSINIAHFHIKSYEPNISIEKIFPTNILSIERINIKAKEFMK